MKNQGGFIIALAVTLGVSCLFAQPALSQSVPGTTKKNITLTDNSGAVKKTAPADGYAIKITGGKATPAKAKKGTKVTVQATVPSGMEFDFWASNTDLDFEDRTKTSTSFTMPGHAIDIKAHFKEIIPSSKSSNIIVAESYAATFKIGDSKFDTYKNVDKTITSTLVIPTTISKIGGNIQGSITAEDINKCIADGKIAAEQNQITSGIKVDVKVPLYEDLQKIKINFPPAVWESLAIENVSQFIISTKEGSITFDKSAITALNSQLTANSSFLITKRNRNTATDSVSYAFDIRFDGTDSRGTELVTLPATGIKATIPYELDNESKASKVVIMGNSATDLPQKVVGASYNKKLKAVLIPLGAYTSYDINLEIK